MNSTSSLLFITHAEVKIDPEVPVTEWGLSDNGKIRHAAFNLILSGLGVAKIYCSAEKKAIDGAAIVCRLEVGHISSGMRRSRTKAARSPSS